MTQDVEELPDKIVRALFELGGRKLVFVEGEDDEEIFNSWFQERLQDVLFYPAGGHIIVQERLQQVAAFYPNVDAYGIRDRDFSSDEAVQAALNEATTRFFTLTRYSVENYLLEPQALVDELNAFLGKQNPCRNAAEVEAKLLELCHRLQALMAANWLLLDNAHTLLPPGFEKLNDAELTDVIAQRLNCEPDTAKALLDEKMALIQPAMETLEVAHTRISGKHLFHQILLWVSKIQAGLRPVHLHRLLIRRIKETGAIHAELRFIIEKRILGDP